MNGIEKLNTIFENIANAIRSKTNTNDLILPEDFANKITSIGTGGSVTPSRPSWSGHADVEGLKAIGWTDEDIAYYQENGVNWNEEDDEYHKVTDDNKALYGVLTADNISTYKDRIVYLPKIDTKSVTSMLDLFKNCYSLVAIPKLDTSSVYDMRNMFGYCYSLSCVPLLDTSKVTNMGNMFYYCYSLPSVPLFNTSNVTNMASMFYTCQSLVTIPKFITSKVTSMASMFYNCYSLVGIPEINTSRVSAINNCFYNCRALVGVPKLNLASATAINSTFNTCSALRSIPELDAKKISTASTTFKTCYSLITANLKNIKTSYILNNSNNLSKESLLYMINNEAATSAITITLSSYIYEKYATDINILNALENHPNISIAQ